MSPLCSRNARLEKALVGRAQWETHPGHPRTTQPSKLGKTHLWSLATALLTACLIILQDIHQLSMACMYAIGFPVCHNGSLATY